MPSRVRRERLSGQAAAAPRVCMSDADTSDVRPRGFPSLGPPSYVEIRPFEEDARDIVQDAFVLAIARLDSARNPKAWLIQVVDHLALNHQRKVTRRTKLAERWIGQSRREPSFDEEEVGH